MREKVALYVRVSTDDQTQENQVAILGKWAEQRGWDAVTYSDTGSAFQHADQRALKALLEDCDHGLYKHVLVYDLSRLTRKGPLELMMLLKEFADKGSPVFSYLDTAINVPSEFQPVLVALYGAMAHTFSTQLSARTKAGMARAKLHGTKSGKPIGRPRKSEMTKISKAKTKEEKKVADEISKLEKKLAAAKEKKALLQSP